jgi:amino-acid N-acetyltransferase
MCGMTELETTMSGSSKTVSWRIVPAVMAHSRDIAELINYYAARNRMLFRGLEDLYECIRSFRVCVDENGHVIGCCALEVLWKDLAEVRSLAVHPQHHGHGIGRALVMDAVAEARRLGLSRVFALTYEGEFFSRLGFHRVERDSLPHKVWTDCIRCPMLQDCREVPMVTDL